MRSGAGGSSSEYSWYINNVLPFGAMLMITLSDATILTIVKEAMNGGMNTIVYIVYHDAFGTLILLPFFIIRIYRNDGRPPLTFHLLFRIFILGLLGICLGQTLTLEGTYYSSPTMATAISNLQPAITFLIAVIFRMEKLEIRSSSSVAKVLGTIIAISGAMLFTFYQGPEIFHMSSSNFLRLPHPTNWILGALIIIIAVIIGAIWNILLSVTVREYPDQDMIVFFMCLFGTLQCAALSPFLEPDPTAWVLKPGIQMIAVLLGGVFVVAIRNKAITWCFEKKGPVYVSMFAPMSTVFAVMLGVTFLGESLHLGSGIGAAIIAGGFYTVMWGQAKEKSVLTVREDDLYEVAESSDQTLPLLSSRNESKC